MMATNELEKVIALIDTLSATDRLKLVQYLTDTPTLRVDSEDVHFTKEEIQEMMSIQPASGREIVNEGLKSGAIGSWADKGITDPVEWLAKQRKNRYQ